MEMFIRLCECLEPTDGLWELAPVLAAAEDARDHRAPAEAADQSAAGRRLDGDQRQWVRAFADQYMGTLDAAWRERVPAEASVAGLDEAEVRADPFTAVASLVDFRDLYAAILPGPEVIASLDSAVDASVDVMAYLRRYMRGAADAARTPLLMRAAFLVTAGLLEPLVTRLVQLLLIEDTSRGYTSLADAALEEKARKLCYGSPADWHTALAQEFGVPHLDDLVDWTRLDRLWADRNALIHRGGVTDARHSSKTGSAAGTVIELDADGVRSVIDEIAAARFGLIAGVWDKLMPGSGAMAEGTAGMLALESLRSGRWRQANGLARVQEVFAHDSVPAAAAKVNRWLAQDMGLGPAAIRREVEGWDVTGLPGQFRLARCILLRQDDQALALLRTLLQDGTMTSADVLDWPLFDRLRAEGKLAGLDL
jgi:hypothetical protein